MGELSARKHPRLSGHDYSSDGSYFITLCVKDMHELFGQVVVGRDAHSAPQVQLSEYGAIVAKHIDKIKVQFQSVSIDKYVIMPNHIHMIITVKRVEETSVGAEGRGAMWTSRPTGAVIPTLVRTFKTMITKELGVSMWQRSYHDRIIRSEAEYWRVWRYIEENPGRWAEDRYFVK